MADGMVLNAIDAPLFGHALEEILNLISTNLEV